MLTCSHALFYIQGLVALFKLVYLFSSESDADYNSQQLFPQAQLYAFCRTRSECLQISLFCSKWWI